MNHSGAKTKTIKAERSAFGTIEAVLAVAIIAIGILGVVDFLSTLRIQQRSRQLAIARQLIQDETEALRNASYADLSDRSNQPFTEVAYHQGNWAVEAPASPTSVPNTYTVRGVTGANNPSRQVVPIGRVADGNFGTSFRVAAGSPAGWGVGLYVRYHDSQNYYLLRVSSNALTLSKVISGAATQLWTKVVTINPGTWYTPLVNASGSTINVYLDGVLQTATPVSDTRFVRGSFVLGAFDDVTADFDDVRYNGTVATVWNFDSGQTVGQTADGWQRLSPSDLPSGNTRLTIADAYAGATDVKEVTLSVQWSVAGVPQSLSNVVLINQQTVLP